MASPAPRSSILSSLIVLAITLSMSLLAAEGLVRWLMRDKIVLFPRHHAAAHYGEFTLRRMTPSTVFWHESLDGRWRFETNDKGFRDTKPYPYAKPAGVFRVLVLGDSHTAGFEVDQDKTYAAVLERLLRGKGIRAEILNTGVSGLGTAEQLAFLEQEGHRYQPDAVVVGFFANDFSDNVRSGLFRLEAGALHEAAKVYAPAVDVIRIANAIPGLKWLSENSYLFSLAFNSAWEAMKARSRIQASPELAVKVGEASSIEFELTAALLRRLAAFARDQGALAVLADVPQVQPGGSPLTSIPATLRQAVARDYSTVVWSEDFVAGRGARQRLHRPNGHRHLNEHGHRLLADALAQSLQRERRPEGSPPSPSAPSPALEPVTQRTN